MPGAARAPYGLSPSVGRQNRGVSHVDGEFGASVRSGGGYFRLLPYWFRAVGWRDINERDGMPFPFISIRGKSTSSSHA